MIGLRRVLVAALALVAAAFVLVAVLVPYQLWDAMAFGAWSQLIAEGESLGGGDERAVFLQRPLFYATQGGVWWLLGVDELSGRVLALGFAAGLVAAVHKLGGLGDRTGLAGVLALVLLALSPEAMALAIAGLSDVPTAAAVAVAGALALAPQEPGRWRIAALVLAAAAAGLGKSAAFPALAGLAVATLVGPREELRGRLARRAAPLAAGAAVAIAYLGAQAAAIGVSLSAMLSAGNAGPHSTSACGTEGCETVTQLAARVRLTTLVEALWLGPWLRPFLVFGLVYAGLRALRLEHRRAVLAGLAATLVLPFAAAALAGRAGLGSAAALAYLVAVCGLLAAALGARPQDLPERAMLIRGLVWAFPAIAVWIVLAPFANRHLATAWPALVPLMALAAAPALAVVARARVLARAGCVVVLLGALALNARNLDSLGTASGGAFEAHRVLPRLLIERPGREGARGLADPELGALLSAVERAAGPGDRVASADPRIAFLRDMTVRAVPLDCAGARPYAAIVVRTDPVSASLLPPGRTSPGYWTACETPALSIVAERPGAFLVLGATNAPGS